jgi:hypothetical protein
MTITEANIKRLVGSSFSSRGFVVIEIPEVETQTPDLAVEKEGQRFLVEIKTKEDDPQELADRLEVLRRGQIADSATPFIPQNTISRIIKKAAEQLLAYPDETNAFRLVWLLALGSDANGQYEQFRSTLYGLTNVVGPDNPTLIPCYYLHHSGFFRWRNSLDGAVIATPEGAELCLNTFSPRYEEFKYSEVGRMFGTSVVDPLELERKGKTYLADCEIDRNDENAVLSYAARKYNRPALMTFNMGSLVAYIENP